MWTYSLATSGRTLSGLSWSQKQIIIKSSCVNQRLFMIFFSFSWLGLFSSSISCPHTPTTPTAGPTNPWFALFQMSLSSPPGGVTCGESLPSLWLLSVWMAWSTGPHLVLPTALSYCHHHHHHRHKHRRCLAEEWEGLRRAGGKERQGAATRMTSCWRQSIRNLLGQTSISSCRTKRRKRTMGFLGYLALLAQVDSLGHSVTSGESLEHHKFTKINKSLRSPHRLTSMSPNQCWGTTETPLSHHWVSDQSQQVTCESLAVGDSHVTWSLHQELTWKHPPPPAHTHTHSCTWIHNYQKKRKKKKASFVRGNWSSS